jgi:hypothetical protein
MPLAGQEFRQLGNIRRDPSRLIANWRLPDKRESKSSRRGKREISEQ